MRPKPLMLAGAAATAVAGGATAALLGAIAENVGDLGAGAPRFRTARAGTIASTVALTLALAAAARADLIGAKVVNFGDLGAGVNSFRIFLIFDDPLDQLLAVGGDADVSPLIFDSTTPLVQHNIFEGMSIFDDVPTVADLGGDSWVTIAHDSADVLDHETRLSDGFLGGDGMESVIKGRHFEQLNSGGYFDENPGTPALPDENGQVLIAQFSLALLGQGEFVSYQGTAWFHLGGGDLTARAFSVHFHGDPASPPAIGLLAAAALLGGRRRRDGRNP